MFHGKWKIFVAHCMPIEIYFIGARREYIRLHLIPFSQQKELPMPTWTQCIDEGNSTVSTLTIESQVV